MVDFPDDVKSTKCKMRSQTGFIRDRHGLQKIAIPIPNRLQSVQEMKKRGGFRTGAKP